MKLRIKTILLICVGFSVLSLIIGVALNAIVLQSYSDLETKSLSDNVTRVINQLDQEYKNLVSTAYDWSAWDDTYFFVENTNDEYIQQNLQYESLSAIDINFMAFYNETDALVYNIMYDFEQENLTSLPNSFFAYISENKELLLNHDDIEKNPAGIIFYDDQESPLLVSITPILKSNQEGPIHGSLVIGRFFNDAKIESIADITQLQIALHPMSNEDILDLEHTISFNQETQIYIHPINSTYIAGYTSIYDITGTPVFFIEIDSTREIYNQGLDTIEKIVYILIITMTVLIIFVIVILDRFVTSRLTSLSTLINDIKNYEDLSKHLTIKGNDEISLLEKNINSMLTSLQKIWAMKDSAEVNLQKKIDELERFKTITVDREIKMIELKKQLEESKTKAGGKT